MNTFVRCWSLCIILASAQVSYAWNDAGHMFISLQTFEMLTPKLRLKYVNILKQHPRYREDFAALKANTFEDRNLDKDDAWVFAFASTWPDLSRHFGHVKPARERERLVEKYSHGRWHYVNHPLYISPKDKVALQIAAPVLGIKPAPALQAMNIVQALSFVERKIRNRNLAVENKAVYLSWWLHLMGDLHQPLHNVALFARKRFSRGDRGGNSIRVGKKHNLHSVWDGSLARGLVDWPRIIENRITDSLSVLHASDGRSNYAGWSRESAKLADNKIYTQQVRKTLSRKARLPKPDEAQNTSRALIAQSQAAIAAKRMSLLLSEF